MTSEMFPLPKFKGKGFILPKKRRIPRKTKKALRKRINKMPSYQPLPLSYSDEIKSFFDSLKGKTLEVKSVQYLSSDKSIKIWEIDF
jgi:hypothetical protein